MLFRSQPHPIFRALIVHNSGIEISTESGANARSVFAGEVAQVQQITPLKKAVLIKHGDFFTIYQNLSSVNVQVGDKVSAKQSLGKIRTDADGRTVLKFLVSQNSAILIQHLGCLEDKSQNKSIYFIKTMLLVLLHRLVSFFLLRPNSIVFSVKQHQILIFLNLFVVQFVEPEPDFQFRQQPQKYK